MTRIAVLLVLIASLGACGSVSNGLSRLNPFSGGKARNQQLEIDGVRFRARARGDSADKRDITITVRPVAVNPVGAVEAGVYEATKYCLLTYGGSDTEWTIGPDTPLSQIPLEDDTFTMRGRCTQP